MQLNCKPGKTLKIKKKAGQKIQNKNQDKRLKRQKSGQKINKIKQQKTSMKCSLSRQFWQGPNCTADYLVII